MLDRQVVKTLSMKHMSHFTGDAINSVMAKTRSKFTMMILQYPIIIPVFANFVLDYIPVEFGHNFLCLVSSCVKHCLEGKYLFKATI